MIFNLDDFRSNPKHYFEFLMDDYESSKDVEMVLRSKVAIVGNGAVGKTKIFQQFIGGLGEVSKDYDLVCVF